MAQWRNWTGDRECRPREIIEARTRSEVVAAVGLARERGLSLRAVGAGHSYNEIALSDGLLVRLGGLDRVTDVDRDGGLVRVEAGISLSALHEALDRHGLALPSLGEIEQQTLAGAISTDTHGGGLRYGSLSSRIASLELVTADGSVLEIDGDRLRAASVGLGSLGVITAATVRCVPAFTLRETERTVELREALERLAEMSESAEHLNLLVFPYASRCLVIERNRTDADPRPPHRASAWGRDILLKNHVVGAANRLAARIPRLAGPLTRGLVASAAETETVDRSHRVFTGEVRFRVVSAEWGLPAERAAEAIEAVRSLFERERYPVAMPLLCRFGAPSDAHLSPAQGRPTCYLEVLAHRSAPAEPMMGEIEEVLAAMGGRPHWAKRFKAGAAELAPLYPGWGEFAAERARLDPEGVFANEWTDRVLGPSGAGQQT